MKALTKPQKLILDQAAIICEEMAKYEVVEMTSSKIVSDHFKYKLSTLEREEFHVAFLNNQYGLISSECLSIGTVNRASVYPREIIKRALEVNAAALIISHNHPSGVSEPSQADKDITEILIRGLDIVDVRVLDHIIVAKGDTFSFAQHGLI